MTLLVSAKIIGMIASTCNLLKLSLV